ncbi:hypothetical protein A8M77_15320 [Variovorax sp. JS1663]|nr:hypothetical protein A8M77_15320 [Variovorax sp. JS1663]
MPPELRERLERHAADGKRSLNAEIVSILEQAIDDEGNPLMKLELARLQADVYRHEWASQIHQVRFVTAVDLLRIVLTRCGAQGLNPLKPREAETFEKMLVEAESIEVGRDVSAEKSSAQLFATQAKLKEAIEFYRDAMKPGRVRRLDEVTKAKPGDDPPLVRPKRGAKAIKVE